MTPYAILAVKPNDSDEVIRKAYHDIAKQIHPDKANGVVSEGWHVYTAAYTAIKTSDARASWLRQQNLLANVCTACEGSGVRGTRMFKGVIRSCSSCAGKGRL